MLTEIQLNIYVNETTLEIVETKIGVAVSSPIPYETMDFLMCDVFRTLANRIEEKIKVQQQNNKLN